MMKKFRELLDRIAWVTTGIMIIVASMLIIILTVLLVYGIIFYLI